MTDRILRKDAIGGFLDSLRETMDVLAPARDPATGKVVWRPVEHASDVRFDLPNTDLSPKEFLFPQDECLMRFSARQGDPEAGILKPEPPLDRPRLLLNVRPCDATAVALLDGIFCTDEESCDPYWVDKRGKTFLVGLGCTEPGPACFCSSMGCGPFAAAGLDILMTDLGETLLVHPVTRRGALLVEALPEASEADRARASEIAAEAGAALPADPAVTEALSRAEARDILELYDMPLWDRFGEVCLNCATCTYVCPTCHCFDIQDEVKGGKGRRVRVWDNCMQRLFTEHASGHNPRPKRRDRIRQRFMHKLRYIPMRRGAPGCTGCGRCVRQCPVNIDVREVALAMGAEGIKENVE